MENISPLWNEPNGSRPLWEQEEKKLENITKRKR
jgi:hypothetical protein